MGTFLTYFLGLLVVGGLLFLLASLLFGRGEELAPMPPDVTPVALPDGRAVTGRDVRRLRMSVVLRGYRMHEVDWILDQLAGQLDERDREILRLREERDEALAQLMRAPDPPGSGPRAEPAPPAATGGSPAGDAEPAERSEPSDPAEPSGPPEPPEPPGAMRARAEAAREGE